MKGKTCGLFLGILIFITGILTCQLKGTILPPERYSVTAGEPLRLKLPAFVENNLEARIIGNEYESLSKSINPEELKSGTIPLSSQFGQQIVRLTLFGVLPVRDMIVSIVPEVRVIPGGQSIGVLLHSQGIVVVDSYEIQDETGRKINPAAEAGIMKNDHILRIGGENVISDSQVRDLAAKAGAAGQPLIMEVKRGDKVFLVRLKPVFCKETRRYKIGLMIRDSAAGVGTLTFYDPMTMSYGALGHIVNDTGTNRPVDLGDGKIVGATVQGIIKGKRGQPGEKIGTFQKDELLCGTVAQNTKLGIFGRLQKPLENISFQEPIPVAAFDQIHEGPAEMLTVLKGDKIEKFNLEIVRINPRAKEDGKGLVIQVSDPGLLQETGGIIQGMSGSPIIQDGRLVGAVTHVFVNDPTKGYGVPAEWMLREGDLFPAKKEVTEDLLRIA